MHQKFLSFDTWPRIHALSMSTHQKLVAVPFLGQGATKRLPLRKGDILIVRFDKGTIKAGMTDPREIVKYIKRGVQVHSTSNLHAKVFVLGGTAIVGSQNVSANSEVGLVEAAIETSDPGTVRKCKSFVKSLRGDIIELPFAEKMIAHYHPPKRGHGKRKQGKNNTPVAEQSGMWIVPLVRVDWTAADYENETLAKEVAQKRITKPRVFGLDDFKWDNDKFLHNLQEGQRVLMCIKERDKKVMVSPPGRVLTIRVYKSGRTKHAIVFLAIRKKLSRRNAKGLIRRIGNSAKGIGRQGNPWQVKSRKLASAIGSIWPSSGD
jgi:hypothetical protein